LKSIGRHLWDFRTSSAGYANRMEPFAFPPRVLIVDDEPDIELLIQQQFRGQIRAGHISFVFATNGAEALALVQNTPDIDLIFTDINMPVMDGLTLLSSLPTHRGTLRAVVMSAYGDMENIRAAMNRGAADFLTKPIDFSDMEATLRKLFAQIVGHRELLARESQLKELERELSVAGRIQQSLLPANFNTFQAPGWSVHAGMRPAKEVGGDLYDLFHLPTGELGFLVGDVSGKGIPAALYMAVSKTLLRTAAMKGASPAEAIAQTNEALLEQNTSAMFVTIFCGYLNRETGVIRFSCAGHNPPIWKKKCCSEYLELHSGIMAGIFPSAQYINQDIRLETGESLVVYSDGITESMTEKEEFYGEERLLAYCHNLPHLPASALTERVIGEAESFANGAPQADDMTVLTIVREQG
jgi:phosphoserine phosphatase RsbU/P